MRNAGAEHAIHLLFSLTYLVLVFYGEARRRCRNSAFLEADLEHGALRPAQGRVCCAFKVGDRTGGLLFSQFLWMWLLNPFRKWGSSSCISSRTPLLFSQGARSMFPLRTRLASRQEADRDGESGRRGGGRGQRAGPGKREATGPAQLLGADEA